MTNVNKSSAVLQNAEDIRKVRAECAALRHELKTLRQQVRELTTYASTSVDLKIAAMDDDVRFINDLIQDKKHALFTTDLMTSEDFIFALDYSFAHIDSKWWVRRDYSRWKNERRSLMLNMSNTLKKKIGLKNMRASVYRDKEMMEGHTQTEDTPGKFINKVVYILRNADKYEKMKSAQLGRAYEEQWQKARNLFQQRHPELTNPYYKPPVEQASFL